MANNDFPINALPDRVRSFVEAAAMSIGCDPAFVAVPSLVTAASAIGASSNLLIKQGWREPSILWAGIVAPSGTGKSPALDAAIAPMMCHHKEAARAHAADPDSPRRKYVTGDCTLESVAMMLGENPQGMLLARDELSGWLGAFDKYHNGKGSDAAGWLSLHSGVATIVDRKRSESVCVPNPRLSLIGTIQPAVLEKCIASHVANGMAARLLLCQPTIQERRWTDAELRNEQPDAWAATVDRLLKLHGAEPVTYRLGEAARACFVDWFDSHNDESAHQSDAMRSLWSKLEAACARIALVLHLLDWASTDSEQPGEYLLRASVHNAVRIAEFFKEEARTIYASWDASPMAREVHATLLQVQRMGGACTEREYARRCHITADEAMASLQRLVSEELARWQTVPAAPQGGRPTRRLILLGDRVTQP